MSKIKDITGQRFGRLVALERRGSDRHGGALWLCRCDCGQTKVISNNCLQQGNTKSCGCWERKKHGQYGSLTWRAWRQMRVRCNVPNHKDYQKYGGRGIEDRYPGFEAFREQMGECPPGCDLHRVDNDGHYEPGNCVWLEHHEHMRLHALQRRLFSATATTTFPEISSGGSSL